MATTFTLEIKKAPTSQGRFPIFIRITKDRKHKRIKTSVELNHLVDWNPKGAKNQNWVRTSERNAAKWNEALSKELEAARALYRENKQASIDTLAKIVKNDGASDSFLKFAKDYIAKLFEQGDTSAKHWQTFCNRLEGFLAYDGRQDLTFSDLSPALLADFEAFLLKEKNERLEKEERRLHQNYIRALLKRFRTLVNKAIKEGKMPANENPFANHAIPKELPTGRKALDESEVAAIAALEYPAGTWLWHTKNAFLLSFYCAGMRAGDLLQLRWQNITNEGTRLDYKMSKNHKQRNYPLMPQAQDILALYRKEGSQTSDYIFPFLDNGAKFAKDTDIDTMPADLKKALFNQIYSKNTLLNRNLKKIAQDAGISKALTFHISRHTFASIAVQKSIPSKVVQEALAHSSLATTEKYLHSFSTEENDSALQKVFTANSKQDALLAALKGLDPEELDALLGKLKSE